MAGRSATASTLCPPTLQNSITAPLSPTSTRSAPWCAASRARLSGTGSGRPKPRNADPRAVHHIGDASDLEPLVAVLMAGEHRVGAPRGERPAQARDGVRVDTIGLVLV